MTPDRTSDATEIRNSWDDDAAASHSRPASGPQSDEQPHKAPALTEAGEPCHPEHREHPLTGGKVGKAAQTPGGGDIWEPCSTDNDGGDDD